jgi:hypothetical protein
MAIQQSGSIGDRIAAEATNAARIETLPIIPTTGPVVICPSASTCPLTESIVARTCGVKSRWAPIYWIRRVGLA